ncbi:hypothetical protein [Flavobacterium ustbae]|uniref:hypothetical protein n=1 Tax=Flavobacterium ustbae TaxID=2488790 RepID=UPI000F774D10|nr:hypothetical protein [Flavobacterium ustbae]
MTKTRRVGGNATYITRGVSKEFANEIEINSNGRIEYNAPEYSYGEPEARPISEEPQKAFSGWWSPDYEGIRNMPEQDSNWPKAYLEETVYFQLNVSESIPVGTSITFQLWDKDNPFNDLTIFDDAKLDGKRVYKTAMVRNVNGQHRITIELYLNPKWDIDIKKDEKLSVNSCLEFYWTWKYHNTYWKSKNNILDVYRSKTTLFIKPAISDKRYGLPEIYANNGSIIVYAIDKLSDGTIKKFSTIRLRTITTFKFQADINKFKREIYNEAINLETNKLESANYEVEEMTSFFYTRKNASQIYIDENIIEVPIEARGKLAVKNFGTKVIKFAKEAAKVYEQIEILKEMKEMIPELSSNEKFNMPSLSTFVGFVPQLAVFAFGVEVIGWMVKGSLKESNDIVDESMWADWQNAKAKGLKNAQNFISSYWAIDKEFRFIYVSKEMLDNLLKGKFKTKDEFIKLNNMDQTDKSYVVATHNMYDESTKKIFTIVDSIFINV